MLILLLVLGFVAVILIGLYNGLVTARMSVKEAFADIDTLLKQRFDMIPNLVNIVKGYAKHEKELLENITKYRSMVAEAKDVDSMSEADGMLTKSLKTLFAVAENYPDLKANQNFIDLQQKLVNLENEIQKSRRYYNATVKEYNTKISLFPAGVIAPMLGFTPEPFFKVLEEEKENVKVEF